jgi:cardiolipin synthase
VRVVGSTPGSDNRITFIVYVAAITFAEHSIHLTNAYFIPDDQIPQGGGSPERAAGLRLSPPTHSC